MAEMPQLGKQPAKRQPPSRLRHEVRPDSTDDERAPDDTSMLVCDSQTVVPETQLEYAHTGGRGGDNESDYGEPLTPTSAAIVDKLAVKKGPAKADLPPIGFQLFSKVSIEPDVRFSFASHAKKAPELAFPKVNSAPFQPIVEDGPVVGSLNQSAGNIPTGE